jgi:hypothetical protein
LLWTGVCSALAALAWLAHYASYRWIKERTLRERVWDYNICCGTTDGGGINADIVQHANVPRFELINDVARLPHADKTFERILCSHTIEHVPDPKAMFRELRRIGRNVTILVPPLWDFTAALNPFEHQVIFLSLRSRHENTLPPFIRFAPAQWLQSIAGQRINADTLATASKGGFSRWLDYGVPTAFACGAALAFVGNLQAWWWVTAGCVFFWASKKSWTNRKTA